MKRINGFFENQRAIIEFFGLCIAVWVLLTYRHANDLTQEAVRINKEETELNRHGLELSQKALEQLIRSNESNRRSVELNEKSVVLTRDSVELTRQSLLASQKALALANAANEISAENTKLTAQMVDASKEQLRVAKEGYDLSNQSLTAASAPWIEVKIKVIEAFIGPGKNPYAESSGVLGMVKNSGHDPKSSVEIQYSLRNDSDSPAIRAYTELFIEKAGRQINLDSMRPGVVAIMPKSEVDRHASILVGDPKGSINKIKTNEAGIKIYVWYLNRLKQPASFLETFHYIDGKYNMSDIEFDPPEEKIFKMMAASVFGVDNWGESLKP